MIGKDLDEQIVDEIPAIENTRLLLGFMRQSIGVERQLNAHTIRNPVFDQDDFIQMKSEKEGEFIEKWEQARASVVDPPSFIAGNVDHRPLPETDEIEDHLEEFKAQEHFQRLIANIPEDQWWFRLMPIEKLVAFQPSVTTTGYQDIPTSDDGWLDVIEYTLPIRGNKYIMTQSIQTANRQGCQIVSRGPNVDLAGFNVVHDEDTDAVSVNFQVQPRVNIVQVVHFQDRFILKNGYHRSFQLLNAGETHVPAFVRRVGSYPETGGANPDGETKPGMLPRDTVMDSRPPLLSDFLTDAAIDIDSAGANKVIRIIAETTGIRR